MTLQDTITAPEMKSLGEYNIPSRSAKELYGDDMLLMCWWKGNPWFVAAACFRVPEAMPFGEFWEGVFVPYHEEDPDFDASKGWEQFDWFHAVNVRHEALCVRMGVRDLHRLVVAAAGLKLRAA